MTSSESRYPVSIIVLAAGEGTRMKSRRPKVLHPVGGRAMLGHVLDTAASLSPARTAVVVAPSMAEVTAAARDVSPGAEVFTQEPALGTAHAVLSARPLLEEGRDILILYGDTPLIRARTLEALLAERRRGADVVVLGFDAADPGGYGRLLTGADGTIERIVEANDAGPDELAVRTCNSGVMVVNGAVALELLEAVGTDNAKGEYYLTDIVALARARGGRCAAVRGEESEVLGVNSRADLAAAEAVFQDRQRRAAMENGVTLLDPSSVYFSFDTRLGRDVVVGQNVVFGPGVEVGEGVTIKPFCHLEGTVVEEGATIGPFARLRPGAEIGPGAHIGNFVEIKKSVIESGAKINHLTYIGDAFVGAAANIGAGTITCNYDGRTKSRTHIGRGAFIGSNNSLVAPVTIGEGAYTGSGSVITKDVEADALSVARAAQKNIPGWAARQRAKPAKDKPENTAPAKKQ